MNTLCRLAAVIAALAAIGLTGCMDDTYYVKTDGSPDVTVGISHMNTAHTSTPLELGVTFKSDGKVSADGSNYLFWSVHNGISQKGLWDVHRIGNSGDDFGPEVASIIHMPAGAALKPHAGTAPPPRMLVLVEDSTDAASGTKVQYILSGMSQGTYGVNKVTDRYEVTITYRDPDGVQHVYHNHQDLLFSAGSKLFGHDPEGLQGMKSYQTAVAAFDAIVDNSVNGTRRGQVLIGDPKFSDPSASKR